MNVKRPFRMQLLRVAGATMLASLVTSTTSACAELAAGKLVADGLALTSNLVENSRVETEKDALALAARGDRLRDRASPDYTAAHDAYRMALKLEPRNPYLHVAIATAYIRQAHENLEASYPSLTQWLGNPAAARDAKKFVGRAIASCNDALKINPNHFGAHFALAEAYARMERYQESLVKLDEIEGKQLIPVRQQAAFYAWRGYVRSQLGKRSASLEDLEHAVEVGRPYPFSEYADALANPPNACEWLSSCGAVARFDAVVGEPVPRAPRREQRLLLEKEGGVE